ncbi:hypothetical protein CTU88_06290 [Streptomyces sp. JV178]|uniref:S1 family peptidase n=1 Tax=Streptomyces sp. JV178 TaxID=858632 RepID=UPI000C1B1DC9|nr:serine protease [Streptomyces sp. JV178]PIM73374.1 hypothetical protein CTU88_06290 [Streptomyces sp. JV178]
MEETQVVQVRAGAGFGSGYLVAPRLVLTAAHLVPPEADGAITVSLPGGTERFPVVVRWRRDDGETVDAALLEIPADDGRWSPPSTLRGAFGRRPQRWGRCVTVGTEIPVAALGFPRQQRTAAGRRDREVLIGRVRPHAGPPHEILDDAGPLRADLSGLDGTTAARTTSWSGMSGAAVFADGGALLLGVVQYDRRPGQGTRLTYTRSEDLLALDGFRAVVRQATSVDPQAEPAELARLLEQAPPKREIGSPSMLLRADAEVVSFHGREDTLEQLERWCVTDSGGFPAVRVITAPGGQGKTRLARRLTARMRDLGWVAGQVVHDPPDLDVLRGVRHPLLLVVDYAETRPELVRQLRQRTEQARHPVRLLLLARSLGTWQTRAARGLREIRLHALSPAAPDREHAFRTAARDLSRRLAEATGDPDVDWAGLAETLPARRATAAPGAETALTVQMAALAALLRRVRLPSQDGESLEAELLEHETKYWHESADRRGLGRLGDGLLARAVAAAVLCPALGETEAHATVARLLPAESPLLIAEVAAWLRDLYPSADDRYWGQLEPDRLAETHACEQILLDPRLLGLLFDRAPDHQRVQTLTVLARAAVAHANAGRAEEAATVIGRLRQTLRSVPADAPLTAAVLRAHSDTLPEQSHVLREYALDVARALSGLCGAAGDDPRALRDRAWALHNLAERQSAVGDWARAREAAAAAAELRERLAADGTATHRTEWADSLLMLSQALRMTGSPTRAYDVGGRALDLFRALAEEAEEAHEGGGEEGGEEGERRGSGLVRALIHQSQVVWRLDPSALGFDQVARSDDHSAEAVRRARDLVARRPDLDPLLLTRALAERGASLWRFQRHPEAVSLSEEAVEASRRLAGENPDAYTADLARALMSLAVDLDSAGRPHTECMALLREAIGLMRPLAEELPAVHRPTLAQMLHNLAWEHHLAGDDAAARACVDEAIEHRRALTREPYGTERPALAQSLGTLATFLSRAGDHEAAAECAREALEVYARAEPLSASDLNSRSGTALGLARSYDVLGRPADALDALNEGLAVRRRLSEYAPSLYTEGYANALHDLSDLYWRHDRQIAVRIVLRQALPHYRRLARVDEGARRGLAECLHDLGSSYGTSWALAERAVTALREAYRLRGELAAADPAQEEQLAMTCAALCRALLKASVFPEAVRVAEHEVRLRRGFLAADRDGQEWPFCFALLRLANSRAKAGEDAAAWRTALEAEEACAALLARPGQPPEDAAWLLHGLGETLSLCGRHDVRRAARALRPARRALRLYRDVVAGDPSKQNGLRWIVEGLAKALERVGRHAEAVDVQLRRGV